MTAAIQKMQTVDLITWSNEQRDLIKRTCAPGSTDDELAMFLHVAARSGLDPLRRQLHFTKIGGRIAFIADVNGLQARAAKEADFEGILHAVVYEGDEFSVDEVQGAVLKHTHNPFKATKPLGAWAVVRRRGMLPFLSIVRFAEYLNPNNPLWNSKPAVMIDKCAKSTALRLAYPEQLGSIYDEAELGKEERELNAPPESNTRTEQVKNLVQARLAAQTQAPQAAEVRRPAVIDVAPGETEQQAEQRALTTKIHEVLGGQEPPPPSDDDAPPPHDEATGEVSEEPLPPDSPPAIDTSKFTVPFGRDKGTPLPKASKSSLEYLKRVTTESINDAGKVRFREKNEALLAAVDAELASR